MTAALAYADEVTLLPAAFFRQLLARLSVPGARLIGTTNPDSPRHWLRTDCLDRAASLTSPSFLGPEGDAIETGIPELTAA
ncbi:hypothetical protein HEK616_84240 (plasmid) [Streptomyces nigrescens]|uniref:Uncharacterized protein n=1 Tax=Streptomyces nigrescens TaxID=1920 RepID=A0ABN6RAX8_STRNI|nr:hypothetical protein [Streptomyces nigrescens]BDM74937.1 hypothetical protein HEK616_84240 [Streptomyces nigrescens]